MAMKRTDRPALSRTFTSMPHFTNARAIAQARSGTAPSELSHVNTLNIAFCPSTSMQFTSHFAFTRYSQASTFPTAAARNNAVCRVVGQVTHGSRPDSSTRNWHISDDCPSSVCRDAAKCRNKGLSLRWAMACKTLGLAFTKSRTCSKVPCWTKCASCICCRVSSSPASSCKAMLFVPDFCRCRFGVGATSSASSIEAVVAPFGADFCR
mmetsp:Transcript_87381/g.245307  ORF Transcript_87381/g.245307 Transcript_87381/m.245307 type:complete len:209 (+) Transcript_87381:1649-2275(+)